MAGQPGDGVRPVGRRIRRGEGGGGGPGNAALAMESWIDTDGDLTF